MHYFIDESGIFDNPANKTSTASCVAALVIPSSKKKKVFRDFVLLTNKWLGSEKEIKGKNLDEAQISAIVQLLKRYDLLLEIIIIDLGIHTTQEITDFKKDRVKKITKNITLQHHLNVQEQANEIEKIFESMPNPIFIQSFIMLYLIPRILFNSINYYARRIPQELKWFYWTVDAKQNQTTQFEEAWSTLIFPAMTGQTLENPSFHIEGGDYSYFEKFKDKNKEKLEFLENEGGFEKGEVEAISLKEILGRNFNFKDSKNNIGLQIVDVLVNATQRALNGKLKKTGWEEIGCLMTYDINNLIQHGKKRVIQFIKITLDKNSDTKIKNQRFIEVNETYKSKAKYVLRDDELTITKRR